MRYVTYYNHIKAHGVPHSVALKIARKTEAQNLIDPDFWPTTEWQKQYDLLLGEHNKLNAKWIRATAGCKGGPGCTCQNQPLYAEFCASVAKVNAMTKEYDDARGARALAFIEREVQTYKAKTTWKDAYRKQRTNKD